MSWTYPNLPDAPPGPWFAEAAKRVAANGYLAERQRFSAVPNHRQLSVEISFALSGNAAVLTEQSQPVLHAVGTIVVIPAGIAHQFAVEPNATFERIVVCLDVDHLVRNGNSRDQFPLDWLNRSRVGCTRPASAEFTRLSELARQMIREEQHGDEGWHPAAMAYMSLLLIGLDRHIRGGRAGTAARFHSPLVERALSMVQRRLQDPPRLAEMARLLEITPEHLTRSFRASLGIPFHQYVLQERIAEAKRLLNERRDLAVTDIAFDVGFTSSSEFARAFRRLTHLTPSEFRDRYTPKLA